MLYNRVSTAQLLQRRVAVSAPFLRPLTCYAAAEATPEAATTSVKVNEVYSGKVTKIIPGVAFVTLDNNVLGRLHISMLSKERVESIEEVFAVGDELKAVVVSNVGGSVTELSTKALELVPGQMKTDKQVGSVVTGTAKVRRKDGWLIALNGASALVRPFNLTQSLERGQSVQIDELCSGKVTKILPEMVSVTLDNNDPASLHISMISRERVDDIEEVFAVGDELKAVVVSIAKRTGIKLSTKALELVPGQMKTDKQVGSVVTGTAKMRRKDGWMVMLDGVAALVRNYDQHLERRQSVQSAMKGKKRKGAGEPKQPKPKQPKPKPKGEPDNLGWRWNENVKLELQHLAAATPAGTSLVAIQRHVAVTLATWDAVWEEYLHPKWAEQKTRLHGAQEKVLERYFKKLEEEAAIESQKRWGTRKQLVVFFGNAGIGTRVGWGAKAVLRACRKVVERPNSGKPTDRVPGKVVTVDEFRTSRVSSAMNTPLPCEVELDRSKPTRLEGWKPQPAAPGYP
ncbi:uncharacterized protein HaLaN_12605 [Haematococcus lacustris]|uniref:S1 motif domain-containing protein n=1 Tax=Haematococcus lacustris TaxID=44745 RepID=A0A699ZBH2_HAELA|nr:uncharacterized protein HaLaN_12605 [Haematococcus lacustris]